MSGLIVDNFAGGGGASTALEAALGRSVDIAINHDPRAIAMHAANHPKTKHFCENVWDVDPIKATEGRPVDVAWFSPDCTHFSKAKGDRPKRSKRVRGLAWIVLKWAGRAKPRVIFLENVEEFEGWGPLTRSGKPCKKRKGITFRMWVDQLRSLGYVVEWRHLVACDYGAPTIRKRLFLVARRDGEPIVWPTPTHGPALTGLKPFRTAAEIIDWSTPCPSIFTRKKPLADATMRRIAKGIKRYVLDNPRPFIIPVSHSGDERAHDINEPLRTITGSSRSTHAVVQPFLSGCGGRAAQSPPKGVDEPMNTVTSKADQILVAPIITKFQENSIGQDVREPMHTVMAGAPRFGVVSAFLAQHNGGMVGHDMKEPVSTLTGKCSHQQLVTAHMLQMKGSERRDRPADEPTWAITAKGFHIAEVRAFLIKYFGTAIGQGLDEPLHTATSKARFGLVTIEGALYEIADIGMRMLKKRELFNAQGFPPDYKIDADADGKPFTNTESIRMCGNSVSPPPAIALAKANTAFLCAEQVAA